MAKTKNMNIENSVTLIGNLGRDFELKDLGNGRMVAKSSLATSEGYKNKDGEFVQQTAWHNLTVWGKRAKVLFENTKKGSHLAVSGKLQYNKYKGSDGFTRYATDIVVTDFKFLSAKPSKPPF